MLVLLLGLIFRGRLAPLWKETAPPAKMRLAILPFTNIGSRAENQEICDGLVEALATKFTQIAQFHENLSVISSIDIRTEKVNSVLQARRLSISIMRLPAASRNTGTDCGSLFIL